MSYIRRNDAYDVGKTLGYLFLDFKRASIPKKITIVAGIFSLCGMFYLVLSSVGGAGVGGFGVESARVGGARVGGGQMLRGN
tara:strand:- start:744 stop:989 length:246 start_codon:yes stop_codon:yes gene_type:complete